MRLTELVHDPYEDFDDSDEPTAAEREGRAAVREALEELRASGSPNGSRRTRTS